MGILGLELAVVVLDMLSMEVQVAFSSLQDYGKILLSEYGAFSCSTCMWSPSTCTAWRCGRVTAFPHRPGMDLHHECTEHRTRLWRLSSHTLASFATSLLLAKAAVVAHSCVGQSAVSPCQLAYPRRCSRVVLAGSSADGKQCSLLWALPCAVAMVACRSCALFPVPAACACWRGRPRLLIRSDDIEVVVVMQLGEGGRRRRRRRFQIVFTTHSRLEWFMSAFAMHSNLLCPVRNGLLHQVQHMERPPAANFRLGQCESGLRRWATAQSRWPTIRRTLASRSC